MSNDWEEVEYFAVERNQKALRKMFIFGDFNSALQFTNKIGQLADDENHHPDINLGWGYVQVWLTTHSEHKITEKDHKLAQSIDGLIVG